MEFQTGTGQKLPAPKVLAIVIVALGVLILGAIYLIVFSQKKGSQESQNSASIPNVSNQQQEEGNSPKSPVGMAVLLNEVGGSGQSGIAVIGEKDGKTLVTLGISGASKDSVEPVNIYTGSCLALGDVKYPLKDVVGDNSETTLDFGIDKLRNELPLALSVRKSASEKEISVACGDIK